MERLTKKDVYHVADLACLKEDEIDVYETQLNDILTEIDKIINVEIMEQNIMISPTYNKNRYNEDIEKKHIEKSEVLNMVNKTNGEFIVVSRVLSD